jgi:hypothetical protein
VGVKPESGGFYREEAARLASEAARAQKPPPPPEPVRPAPPPYVPPVLRAEPDRPALAPEPASNQNYTTDDDGRARAERRPWTAGRIIAWIVLLPLYVVMAAVSIWLIGLFIKGLLGL